MTQITRLHEEEYIPIRPRGKQEEDVNKMTTTMIPEEEENDTLINAIEKVRGTLWKVNKQIHSHPELAYEEHRAHDTLVSALRTLLNGSDGDEEGKEGKEEGPGIKIKLTPHAHGIPTSFEAEAGSGGRVVTFNAEYDALPGIGHACGHNLIATSSLGAFFGVVEGLKKSKRAGRVRLLGTPAEENAGGKIALIEAGAYEDVDACVMIHPGSANGLGPGVLGEAYVSTLAIAEFEVVYTGRPAHAALAPWEGVNALDAAVQGYNAVSALRQQIRPDERVHGIISDGGAATNIIPDRAVLSYGVRAPTLSRTRVLKERVVNCFRAAAVATGCEVEIKDVMEYADLRNNRVLSTAWAEAMAHLGHKVSCNFDALPTPASTDQGNVSYVVPSWHGSFGIPTEKGVNNHTRGFTESAGTTEAFGRAVEVAKGMAVLGFKVLSDDGFAEEVKRDWEKRVRDA